MPPILLVFKSAHPLQWIFAVQVKIVNWHSPFTSPLLYYAHASAVFFETMAAHTYFKKIIRGALHVRVYVWSPSSPLCGVHLK